MNIKNGSYFYWALVSIIMCLVGFTLKDGWVFSVMIALFYLGWIMCSYYDKDCKTAQEQKK